MINRAILTGRLTRDVDLRYTQSGRAVGSFTLAVDRQFTDASGERQADFINCVIWGKSAESFANYMHKGSLVGIDGRIQTRNYENKQGQKVYVTEINVDNWSFLESRNANNNANGGNYNNPAPNGNGNSYNQAPTGNNGYGNAQPNGNNMPPKHDDGNNQDPFAKQGDQIDISDDDLPF